MLLFASTADTLADEVTLLAFYSLGLGLPFFAAAMGLDRCLAYFKQAGPYMGIVSKVSGVALIIFGIVLYEHSLALVSAFFERYGIGVYLDLTWTIHEYLLRRPILSSGEAFFVRPPRRTVRTTT